MPIETVHIAHMCPVSWI